MLSVLIGLYLISTSQPTQALLNVQRCTIDGYRWEARIIGLKGMEIIQGYEIRRNGKVVRHVEPEDGGPLYGARFLKWPYGGKLLVITEHSQCGHGQSAEFFTLRRGQLKTTHITVMCEVGGPIFKDLDHDGRLEMIFDNNDWYTFYGDGPDAYHVYKVHKNGKIKFWKMLPNPKRKHVKWLLP